MSEKKLFLFLVVLFFHFVNAQNGKVTLLSEMVISDTQLRDNSNTLSVQKLQDSLIRKNQVSLTTLLNYNSVVYFKENGLGMVSSPSFRGTTAQQTAVIWNGININSQLLGQSDFNTINAFDYNAIAVRSGGGSAIYGSGAVGGSIHLSNDIQFNRGFKNRLRLQYGSFETINTNYQTSYSDGKLSFGAGFSYNKSDNDYEYPGTDKKNENGQFHNSSFNAQFGYKVNSKNTLRFYSQFFDAERHFSGTISASSKSMYQDFNSRNLLEWVGEYGKIVSKTKIAFLSENYKYFENHALENFDYGKVESFIGKYDFGYKITSKIQLNAIADFTQNKGVGTNFSDHKRTIGGGSLLLNHQVTDRLYYEASIRKEITDNYESPLLFSFGSQYKFSKFYSVRGNISRNFRIPTFNDLYWQGGGNVDLKPENSLQYEIGNVFKIAAVSLTVNGYYIDSKDMLRWLPQSNGLWQPVNTEKVKIYGGEALLNWNFKIGSHHFAVNGTYAYTVSENDKTKMQLIYVPYHKATFSAAYSFRRFSVDYQMLYNGEVFTSSDNFYVLDDYSVSNIGLHYDLGKKDFCQIGGRVLNVWNEEYENVAVRPMPGRNYTMYLTFNF